MVRSSLNRNLFSNGLSCVGESSDILLMTYVVLKGYLYYPIDCIRPTVAIERPIDCIRPVIAIEREKYTEKNVLLF